MIQRYIAILHTSLWSLPKVSFKVIFKAFNSASAVPIQGKQKTVGVAAASWSGRCALDSIQLAVPSSSNAT